jgi:hypothetical protein
MSTLLKSISNSDTIIEVSSDSSFPENDGIVVIGSEHIGYVKFFMGKLYGCTRGFQSTVAASHDLGAAISLVDYYASFSHALAELNFTNVSANIGTVGTATPQSTIFVPPTSGMYLLSFYGIATAPV